MLQTRVEPIDQDIQVILSDFSPKERSAVLAQFARETLLQAQAEMRQTLGEVPEHTTTVDGARGAKEEQVRPDGVIVYEFQLVTQMFAWIDDQLVKASPKKTGRYSKSHTFYADGDEADPSNPPAASEYVFLSLVPYARKIERGQSKQAPDGVYQAVALLARRRFGNAAKISFGYRSASGGDLGKWASTASAMRLARRTRRRAKPQEWLTRQPAIIITLK